MEHKCRDEELLIIKREGSLVTYKCPICGKEICELGSIFIPINKNMKKCQVYVCWSEKSIADQINALKKVFPPIKEIKNTELVKMVKNSSCLKLGEMYISEANELIRKAESYNLNIWAEETME